MIELFIEHHIIAFICIIVVFLTTLGFSSMVRLYFALNEILDKLENNK